MAFDLLIRNGLVVDGTGTPGRHADIAVTDGKIAEIGRISSAAAQTIDAHGLVVAPGFVDPHTHYDAQICWDGAVTPSSWHGVTSVVMGNCGVGIAPCKPETREIAMKDLVNVEGIPFDVLNKGITWDWETFPEFMDAAARAQAVAQPRLHRAADAVPPLRDGRGVDGARRDAGGDRTRSRALIGEAVDAGAFGFSVDHAQPAHGLRGQAAGLPQRQPRGAEGLRQRSSRSAARARSRSR